jgi:hypothetical protein
MTESNKQPRVIAAPFQQPKVARNVDNYHETRKPQSPKTSTRSNVPIDFRNFSFKPLQAIHELSHPAVS